MRGGCGDENGSVTSSSTMFRCRSQKVIESEVRVKYVQSSKRKSGQQSISGCNGQLEFLRNIMALSRINLTPPPLSPLTVTPQLLQCLRSHRVLRNHSSPHKQDAQSLLSTFLPNSAKLVSKYVPTLYSIPFQSP